MGHAKFSQTAYYIQLLPENIKNSQGIDWNAMGALIPEVQICEKDTGFAHIANVKPPVPLSKASW